LDKISLRPVRAAESLPDGEGQKQRPGQPEALVFPRILRSRTVVGGARAQVRGSICLRGEQDPEDEPGGRGEGEPGCAWRRATGGAASRRMDR